MLTLTGVENPSRSIATRSIMLTSPRRQRLLKLHLPHPPHPSPPLLLLLYSATTTRTSTKSKGETSKEGAVAAAVEDKDKTVPTPTASQTPRQAEIAATTAIPSRILNRVCADGTRSSGRRPTTVRPIAPNSKISTSINVRETTKGAAGCERGDPLLIIKSPK